MKLAIIGLGYVGLTTAVGFAELGHEIVAHEQCSDTVKQISRGVSPFPEHELAVGMKAAVSRGALRVVDSPIESVNDFDAVLICVGTPNVAGRHDLGFVLQATREICDASDSGSETPIIYRSTFGPTVIRERIMTEFAARNRRGMSIYHVPEFLREGSALCDFRTATRCVIGSELGDVNRIVDDLFGLLGAPLLHCSWETSALVKLTDNAWHAAKVAFSNEVARIASAFECEGERLMEVLCMDTKLNVSDAYMRPGLAYGGSCLAKDVESLKMACRDAGVVAPIIDSLSDSNQAHREFTYDSVRKLLSPGQRVLLVGVSFKPGTGDLRDSSMVDLLRRLRADDIQVDVVDDEIAKGPASIGYSDVLALLTKDAEATGNHDVVIFSDDPSTAFSASRVIEFSNGVGRVRSEQIS